MLGHAFGTKDEKFGYKNGIGDEKTHLVLTLLNALKKGIPENMVSLVRKSSSKRKPEC